MQSSLQSARSTASDAELLAAFAASGDDPAFAELVRRHLPLVLAVTRRRLGGSGLAEDAAQQVFIALSRRARQLKGIPCLPAWLQRAAVLESARMARGESRHRLRNQQAGHPQGGNGATAQEQRLDAALAALPERDRQVLLLHHFEKLTYDQVGRRMGMSAEAAQRRGHRALEKLRALLLEQGVSREAAVYALWLGAGLAPVTLLIPDGLIEKTVSLKKAASPAVPWLAIAAGVVLGGGTWAVVQASKPSPPSPPIVAAAPAAARPALPKRALSKPDSELSDDVRKFIALAKKDAAQAWAFVKQRDHWESFIANAVGPLDERDPAAAERFLAVLESRDTRRKTIATIFLARASANFDSAVAWIDGFAEPFEREAISSSNLTYFNEAPNEPDYYGALKFARKPEVRHWLIGEACAKYAAEDETGLASMAAKFEGVERRIVLCWQASILLQRGDPRGLELMDEARPGRAGDTYLRLSRPDYIAKRDPQAVIERLLLQTDNPGRMEMARTLWHEWGKRDARAAAAWAIEQNRKTGGKGWELSTFDPVMNRFIKQP
jgi:RNA polymerase sigma factor (sigma-70 family)